MDFVNGDDVTNNDRLAEAIDATREGSAPANGSTGYDEPDSAEPGFTLRDSCFRVAITELQNISTAPEGSQEKIDRVIGLLSQAKNADNQHRAQVMAKSHGILQDVYAPPE